MTQKQVTISAGILRRQLRNCDTQLGPFKAIYSLGLKARGRY
jgi:hypothetical protein